MHVEASQCRTSSRGPTHNNSTEVMEGQSLILVGSVACDGVLGMVRVTIEENHAVFWLCLT